MFVERFMAWCMRACVAERVEAVEELAEHYLKDMIEPAERPSTEQVFTLLLDDPSPLVRQKLAAALASSPMTPRTLIWGLADDIAEVAAEVYGASPHFREADLVHAINTAPVLIQRAVAARDDLTARTVREICYKADQDAVCEILINEGIVISASLKHDIAKRLGDVPAVREFLLEDDELLPQTRQMLIQHVAGSMLQLTDDRGWGEGSRMATAAGDACNRVTLEIASETPADLLGGYVEHLRETGQLTPALLVRAICSGHGALFETALAALSRMSLKRVQSIIDAGRIPAFRSLYRKTGLPESAYGVFAAAINAWQTTNAADEVVSSVIDQVERDPNTNGALFSLLGRMSAEAGRKAAVNYERQLLLAAA